MEYQIASLFVVAVLNAIFGYLVLKGKENLTNSLFSLFVISVSLWSLFVAFFINTSSFKNALLFANIYYVSAAAIPILFFYFSLFFLEYKKPLKKYFIYLLPFFFLIIVFALNKNVLLQEIYLVNGHKNVFINKLNYFYYIIYFLAFIFLSYYHLFRSYILTESSEKKIQLKFVIWGTIPAYLLGMIFNLFLPAFGNYEFIWLGPLFTLVMVLSIGYAITKHKLFNVKIIATELLALSLWTLLLIRTLAATTLRDQIIDSVVLVAMTVAGVLLVRSVIKEVEVRIQMEELATELVVANSKLRDLDKQKSEFISIASHQLRSPLTAIKGYSSMLIEESFGKVPNKAKEALDRIFQSTQNLVTIVEDLLNISRIEQGRMKYNFEIINLEDVAKDVVEELLPVAKNGNLNLIFQSDRHETYNIKADKGKMRQIITNLIDNAIKYTQKGSIKVNISNNDKKNKILLTISDTGIGLSKETLNKIFKKFTRGKGGSKINTGGSGLGLYVAKEMVKAHKGRIWAQSPGLGKGASFCVELKKEN